MSLPDKHLPFPVRRILYLQKAEVLDEQREPVIEKLTAAIHGVAITFAGSPEEVP